MVSAESAFTGFGGLDIPNAESAFAGRSGVVGLASAESTPAGPGEEPNRPSEGERVVCGPSREA